MKSKRSVSATRSIVMLVIGVLFLFGCASTGEFKGQATGAAAALTKKNYKVVKVGAKGESSGFRLLGFIPFSSPTMSEAKEGMYSSIGTSLEGKAIALVNQTEDRSSMYFILFSIPKITITADVIEYLDESATK